MINNNNLFTYHLVKAIDPRQYLAQKSKFLYKMDLFLPNMKFLEKNIQVTLLGIKANLSHKE